MTSGSCLKIQAHGPKRDRAARGGPMAGNDRLDPVDPVGKPYPTQPGARARSIPMWQTALLG
jgi:hypothetical protein